MFDELEMSSLAKDEICKKIRTLELVGLRLVVSVCFQTLTSHMLNTSKQYLQIKCAGLTFLLISKLKPLGKTTFKGNYQKCEKEYSF